MSEHPWWITERVGDEPLMPEPSRPCAGWIERTRKAEAALGEATRLLREFGSCDPYSGQPYDEVVEFLARTEEQS